MLIKRIALFLFTFLMVGNTLYSQDIFKYIGEGDIAKVKENLSNDISQLTATNNNGEFPIHKAVQAKNMEIVEYLIEQGADVNTKTKFDSTPLQYAAFFDSFPVLQVLIEKGASVNDVNQLGASALLYSANKGNLDNAKLLIENGADLKFVSNTQNTILHAACDSGDDNLVTYLLQFQWDYNKTNQSNETPLYLALENGISKSIDALMNQTNDLSATTTDGSTYLHAAAKGGNKLMCEKLVASGIDVNAETVYKQTALDLVQNENTEVVEILKQHNAIKSNVPFHPKGEYLGQEKPGVEPALFAPQIISTPDFNERDMTISLDGKELYFSRAPVNNVMSIMTMKETDEGWTEPTQASFMKPYNHAEACFSPDDKQMYFISNRPVSGEGPAENWEIWFTDKTNSGWDEAQILGEKFTGGFYPTFTSDWVMYFTDVNQDISRAYLVDAKFTNIEQLSDSVNTEAAEYNSCVAPDGSYIICTSHGWGEDYGQGDLYISFRKEDGSWTKAKNMGPKINTWAREYCPALSRDGKYFFFSSRKFGNEDIFWVSTEIFNELKP